MASARDMITTDPHGITAGEDFDDKLGIPDLNKTAISRIEVTYDSYIRSLTVGINTVLVRKLLITEILDSLHE